MTIPTKIIPLALLLLGCGQLETNDNQLANIETVIAITVPDINTTYETTTLSLYIREGEDLQTTRQIYTETQYKAEGAATYQIAAEPGRSYVAHITYHTAEEDVASTRFCGALTNIISNVATGINHYNPRVCFPTVNSSDVIRDNSTNIEDQENLDESGQDENLLDIITDSRHENDKTTESSVQDQDLVTNNSEKVSEEENEDYSNTDETEENDDLNDA